MSELRSKIAVPLVLAGLLAVLFVAPVSGQGQTSTDKDWILENLARVGDRVQKQIDNVSLMIQLGTGVIAVLAGALALWGMSNYRQLIKSVEERLATKLVDIERQRALMEVNVKRSEELLNHLRDVTEIEEERSPYVLLARAREAAMVVPPRSAEVSSLLSKLAVMQGVNGYDLNSAAMIANMVDEPGLAKVLFAKAIETGNSPYTAAAYLAQLGARDPDSRRHKEVLQSMFTEHYASEEVIVSTANFYIDTEDWDGLEDAMRKAGDAAPSSITPPRNRALAASRKGEAEEKVVRFYDMALEKPGGATSADTLGFYANYLFNNGFPRSNEDALKVKEIFEQLLFINPEEGDQRLRYSKRLYKKTKILEAAL